MVLIILINGFNTFPVYTSLENIHENIDVIIDFSNPALTMPLLDYAVKNHIPMVIATTGFSDNQLQKIQLASKYVSIFQSYNMSYTINLMKRIVSLIALSLDNIDIEILETHHNNKVDAPSGTAILLADSINSALGSSMKYVYNRNSQSQKRSKNEIGISSIRGGNIIGEHSVLFFGPYETLEIKHSSYSRNVFVQGALKAATFIIEQPNGLYNMDNLD